VFEDSVDGVLIAHEGEDAHALATAGADGEFHLDNTETSRNEAWGVDAALRADVPERLTRGLGSARVAFELRVDNVLDRRYTAFGYVDGEPLFIPAATRGIHAGLTLTR
jgi:hypothetical protein